MKKYTLLVVAGILFSNINEARACSRWIPDCDGGCCCIGVFFGSCCDECHCAGTCAHPDPSVKAAIRSLSPKKTEKMTPIKK